MIFKSMSNFHQRLCIGGSLLILALVAIYFSNAYFFRPIFALIVASVSAAAVWEYYQLAKLKNFSPQDTLGIIATVAYVVAVFLQTQTVAARFFPEIVLLLAGLALFLKYFTYGSDPFRDIAITLFGFVYLAIPLACLVSINYFGRDEQIKDGRLWLVYLLSVTKATDTGAYFIGKAFGKRKMAPYISPKKTWEGSLGGLIAGIAISLGFYFLTPLPLSFWESLILGCVLSLLGQIGDLSESLLKRDTGVKDSNQLPGLGGALDTVDSLVFTSPMLYIFLKT